MQEAVVLVERVQPLDRLRCGDGYFLEGERVADRTHLQGLSRRVQRKGLDLVERG